MKLYAFYHLTTGRDIRTTIEVDKDFDIEEVQDKLANGIVANEFMHSVEGGKLVIINMKNVASITVSKAE